MNSITRSLAGLVSTTLSVTMLLASSLSTQPARAASSQSYNINTLAGKVASVNGTAGLQIRMSAFIEAEADDDPYAPLQVDGAILAADSTGVTPPDVTVNQDRAGAPQNETSIAVDPNNPQRIVGSANDYVARTWSCTVGTTPCSALGDGYSGTFYSNDGGQTWAGKSSSPTDLGTLIPGVTRLAGGQYDAGGDPALAFDSRGNVYYAGLGFNRTSAPNTVAVNKGTFDGSGRLTWGPPTFIGQTTSPSILNDKEWIAVDAHSASPFRDRIYVSYTRFIFNPANGQYTQSPIFLAYSSDGGKTFSTPQLISGNVLYDQGSRPVVGPDGTVYVFWVGSTRRAALNSIYMVKSTDGGATWSKPVAVSKLVDIIPLNQTAFRVNSFPAAAVDKDNNLYVTWSAEVLNDSASYNYDAKCADWLSSVSSVRANCYADTFFSKSTDHGATWSTPQFAFAPLNRVAVGYEGTSLSLPAVQRAESVFPAVAASPDGKVYLSAYRGDVVSPWQSCATYDPHGNLNCLTPGGYVHNTKLDYVVANVAGGGNQNQTGLTNHPINTRYQFRGGFIGDYTDIAVGSDSTFHALWTDTNNQQTINWFYGYNFNGLLANQQDVVTYAGKLP